MSSFDINMRILFGLAAGFIILGIAHTGFNVASIFLYVPAIGLGHAAVTGKCKLLTLIGEVLIKFKDQ